MTTLHDRLSDLADEAAGGPPAAGLWAAGQRVHRRRQVGTAVVVAAALAALAGLGGLSWSHSRVTVEPASTETPLGMPDQIWLADENLPGTDDTGPIGPLVAVVPTVRDSWFGSPSNGLIGISATGEYSFLDLPHALASAFAVPALSADGRYVAYWRTGTPAGTPGSLAMDEKGADVPLGVGVYDTVTGQTYEHLVETEHGLQPENLVWAGDRAWFDVWQMDAPREDGQSAKRTEVLSWNPVDDVVTSADQSLDLFRASAWGDSVLTTDHRRLELTSPAGSETVGRSSADVLGFRSPVFVSPDMTRVAGLEDTGSDDGAGPVLVGDLGAPPDTLDFEPLARTADLPVDGLLGWRDDDHLVTIAYGNGTGEATYQTVDVGTGVAEILGYAEGNQPILAADALTGRVFEAPEPPSPLNPLVGYGGGVAILLVAALALLWWRRRVQR